MANMENCFIKSKLVIATASGWLERLVRPVAARPCNEKYRDREDAGGDRNDDELSMGKSGTGVREP